MLYGNVKIGELEYLYMVQEVCNVLLKQRKEVG